MKLKKFRTLEDKINIGLKIFCCILILTIVAMGKSLAEYKQEAEVTFIRARVGKFKTNDIQLAMLLDGEEVETPPSKDNYTVDISCDNADGSWDYDEWLAKIGNIRAGKVKCEVNFTTPAPTISEVTATSEKTSIALSYTASGIGTNTVCKWGTIEGTYDNEVEEATNANCNISDLDMDTLYYYQVCAVNGAGEVCKEGNIKTKPYSIGGTEILKVGDYISMTPTSTSYTLPNDLSGCTGSTSTCVQNTINPSELNLWRVISLNEDGTIDMVSEYVSSTDVYFRGITGYLNLVGGLNTIASQYTDGTHVLRTRHMGYNEQEEYCDPLNGIYTGLCRSDNLYKTDLDLVNKAYGGDSLSVSSNPGLQARSGENGAHVYYFLATRYIGTGSYPEYSAGSVNNWGIYSRSYLVHWGYDVKTNEEKYIEYSVGSKVRPIATLKSSVILSSGDGSIDSPYTLN